MRQVKIFAKGPYDSISSFMMEINSWLEKMSDNPTFRLSDKIKISSPIIGSLVYTFSYEIESEKERRERQRMENEMKAFLNDDYPYIKESDALMEVK